MVHFVNGIHDNAKKFFDSINSSLDYSPLTLIAATTVGLCAMAKLKQSLAARHPAQPSKFTQQLLLIPPIRAKYNEKIKKEFVKFKEEIEESWHPFGAPFLKIPEEGIPYEELVDLVQKYYRETVIRLKDQQMSGTIYQKHLDQTPTPLSSEKKTFEGPPLTRLASQLEDLFTLAFQRTYLFNSLHTKEFALGSLLKRQLIQMVAENYGGNPKEVMGFVTTGGSDSLMTAIRAYRNRGLEQGHALGESVIIAPDSVHASVLKAESAYLVKVVLIPTDKTGQMDRAALDQAIAKHGKKIVALIGSAPSYAKGKIDPIEEMAALAHKHGFGLHVDCCLGGFVGEYIQDSPFLALKGVTSLSTDTHKNGWAPKGSSILVTNELSNGENLAYYASYAIPGWTGGIYGTPNNAGSEPCTPALQALLALLAIGKKGYREKAQNIRNTTLQLAELIRTSNGLQLLGDPDLHVIAFEIDPKRNWREGAIYELADQMEKRGFTLNALLDESLHFCVTDRFAGDPTALAKFKKACQESLDAVEILNREGKTFPKARMYCSLRAALSPDEKQGWGEYLENSLFGTQAAEELVKSFYCALSNPDAERKTLEFCPLSC